MSRVKVGDIRASQLLYTFGVGSLINLPQLSVLVMGLDDWDTAACREITEERLLAAARRRLGGQVARFLHPPVEVEGEGDGYRARFELPRGSYATVVLGELVKGDADLGEAGDE